VAAIDSLRFGELTNPEVRRLFGGVVAGIAHYGNCFGIPTIAGEVYFDKSYEGNPLVNVFCLGVLRHEQIARGQAEGVGNPVFYVGPPTGRDGLAGAAFASQDLTDESAEQQRGAVQVGDPFMEKLVCEACLELLATGAVAGIQDMGAAGLTCSTCETAARAGTGIEIELNKVPQRVPNMTPYEIMLSESQERMLIIVKRGREDEVKRIFEKWDLPWAEIGVVTDTGQMVVRHQGAVVADIPAKLIASESPIYHREAREPAYLAEVRAFTLDQVPDCADPGSALRRCLPGRRSPQKTGSIANTITWSATARSSAPARTPPSSESRKIRCPYRPTAHRLPARSRETHRHDRRRQWRLRLSRPLRRRQDRRGRSRPQPGLQRRGTARCHRQPQLRQPAQPRVVLAAPGIRARPGRGLPRLRHPGHRRQLQPLQSKPGRPHRSDTHHRHGRPDRTSEHITTQWFKDEKDVVILLGEPVDTQDPLLGLGGSAYLQVAHGRKTGQPPRCDLEQEKLLNQTLRGWIASGVIKSAHDCSEGGLAVALAEACISQTAGRDTPRLIGATIDLSAIPAARLDGLLFGETQGRIVISVAHAQVSKVLGQAKILGVPARQIGVVGGPELLIKTAGAELKLTPANSMTVWWNAIARLMGQ
jgi:phosphoribosylformylglycinamidine synthase subunit PurL